MKDAFEFTRKNSNLVCKGIMQGEKTVRLLKEDGKLDSYAYSIDEINILPTLTEEFLPSWTMVYTSHGKKGVIIRSQYRDENGTLHPAIVQIGNSFNFKQIPIWQNQLVKAIK